VKGKKLFKYPACNRVAVRKLEIKMKNKETSLRVDERHPSGGLEMLKEEQETARHQKNRHVRKL